MKVPELIDKRELFIGSVIIVICVAVLITQVIIPFYSQPNSPLTSGFPVRSCVELSKEPDISRHCRSASTKDNQ
jgi:hypothetical protein